MYDSFLVISKLSLVKVFIFFIFRRNGFSGS